MVIPNSVDIADNTASPSPDFETSLIEFVDYHVDTIVSTPDSSIVMSNMQTDLRMRRWSFNI
jgi:hypothetical protein